MVPTSTSSLQVNSPVLSFPMKFPLHSSPASLATPKRLSFHIVSRPLRLNPFLFTSLQKQPAHGVCGHSFTLSFEGFTLSPEGPLCQTYRLSSACPPQLQRRRVNCEPLLSSHFFQVKSFACHSCRKMPGYRGVPACRRQVLTNPCQKKWGDRVPSQIGTARASRRRTRTR